MNLNIRTGLLVAFIAVGLVPLAGLTWLTYERTLAREFSEVEDRHLLLAENLSSALSRYERDIRTTVKTISSALVQSRKTDNSHELLATLGIKNVSVIDA